MTKEVRHVDPNVQGSKGHLASRAFDFHRPEKSLGNNQNEFPDKSNPNRIARIEDPRRLIFDCLSDPAFYLLKLRNQPPNQRLRAYGTLFRSYWDEMEREAEVNGKPTERWGSYLRGLEEARRAFRRDFPDSEFPVDD